MMINYAINTLQVNFICKLMFHEDNEKNDNIRVLCFIGQHTEQNVNTLEKKTVKSELNEQFINVNRASKFVERALE